MKYHRLSVLYIGSALLLILAIFSSFNTFNFQKIALKMVTRSAKDGFTSKIEADIYYSANGKMITYFLYPEEYITITNSKGEFALYNQNKNTVFQSQNEAFSSETSFFYFFLNNKKTDLGLSDMGFQITNTTFEEGLTVTEWAPPVQMAAQLGGVKLVHNRQNPIFMSYKDVANNIIKKTYYYDYVNYSGIDLPTSVTQIDFVSQTDSVLTKTTYSDIRMNNQVDEKLLKFEIPENAIVVSQLGATK